MGFFKVMFHALLLASLVACATHTVRSTTYAPVVSDSQDIPEELLLDVGVYIFDPGIDEIHRKDKELTSDQIRVAESRYSAFTLAETLQRSANWGIVRLMPNGSSPIDLNVSGTILRSNGERMVIRVTVSDSSGREWYTKEYEEAISKFSYDPRQLQKNEPFQPIYNQIANDLLEYRDKNITTEEVKRIRSLSEILFANRFSEEIYGQYITTNRDGEYALTSLPADNDPLLERIRTIRERDFMFIDTVQDYFSTYVRQMRNPYDSWRQQSYEETLRLRELETKARNKLIGGIGAIVGGAVAASQARSPLGSAVGIGAAGGGGYLIRESFRNRADTKMHIEALKELAESFENGIAPQVIALDDKVITLTGSVEEQYEQWREILNELYAEEMGL